MRGGGGGVVLGGLGGEDGRIGACELEVGFDFPDLLVDAEVALVDGLLFLTVMPLKGVGFVAMVEVIDAAVAADVSRHRLRLSVVDPLHLPQVPHVDLVPHLRRYHLLLRVQRHRHLKLLGVEGGGAGRGNGGYLWGWG